MPNAVTQVSVQRIVTLYPAIRPVACRILQDITKMTGRVMNIAQATRSMEEQLKVYARGRQLLPDGSWMVVDKRLVVTNAKPGLSWHCFGLAFDVSWEGMDPYLEKETQAVRDDLWKAYATCVRSYGMRWGGDSIVLINGVHDLPHAEMTFGLTIADANELYEHGGINAVWAHIDGVRKVPVGLDWSARV